jgi:hypothetical protein
MAAVHFELGGPLGWKSGSPDTILEGGQPRIISARFGWDWLSSFRGEDFFLISSPLFSNLHNRPKFELYKHNDELFNIYYGTFYELWTFADFDRLCKLEKRGDGIKKKSSLLKLLSMFSNGGHLGYRTALTDTILKGDHLRIISAKFGWDWLSSFREEFFLISSPFFLICIIGQNRQKFKVHKKSRNIC